MEETTRAYIAGFLDGDGSIVLQLKPRRDYRYGFQIRAVISFYQKYRGRWVLRVASLSNRAGENQGAARWNRSV